MKAKIRYLVFFLPRKKYTEAIKKTSSFPKRFLLLFSKNYFLEEVFFVEEVLQLAEVDFFEQEEDFLLEDLQPQLLICSTARAQNSWSLPEGQPAFCHIK